MTDVQTPESATEMPVWHPPKQAPLVTLGLALALLAAVAIILQVWGIGPWAGRSEQTDNALVRGRTVVMAPQVSGYVTRVLVRDFATVREGQLLALIDDDIYKARLAQARANLAVQLAALANSRQAHRARAAGITSEDAAITDASAQLLRSKADMNRALDLVSDGSISIRERDQTAAALAAAEANLRQATARTQIAREDLRTVDVGRGGLAAQVEVARAQLRLAEIDLLHTIIRAPEAGQLGEIHVRLGQFVTNGTSLMELVPPDRWIIAQFKESQTNRMMVGQPATFTIDALGGEQLKGRITRIAPATGWEFAVLKPDNATGNFVKVPQRLAVLIAIEPRQALADRLRPGMSVEMRIDVEGGK
ncbi:HlyD family secretion protein [Novosphingobium sp. P6W]|uniref:HlyD family secretion protein n=1 Tax=Novosphingobium sp. P6W TaxID=1609758 RepID=UPI0005C2BB16|nr:HlyD family secretion protein [Novosphingobium sp. P6W]AXB80401.1 HlyD family secretion protein [Novosphingobium sp. P6W]KIS31371.1 secretion protein HlyD [Novosphingobium sp. P6W]